MDETQTFLDRAFEGLHENDAGRLRFYAALADAELFLMLTEEAVGENLSPELFELADGRFVLVFDTEDRLAQFAGRVVPYAGISGRILARMLDGQGIGLGLNLDVAASSTLIPAEAMSWLDQTLDMAPDDVEEQISEISAPTGIPSQVLDSLSEKLSTAGGLASMAVLVAVGYSSGRRGHLLAFLDAKDTAQAALAKSVGEALTFSGIEAGEIDVGFFESQEQIAARLTAVGLRLELPERVRQDPAAPAAPGRNPDKPPKLR